MKPGVYIARFVADLPKRSRDRFEELRPRMIFMTWFSTWAGLRAGICLLDTAMAVLSLFDTRYVDATGWRL